MLSNCIETMLTALSRGRIRYIGPPQNKPDLPPLHNILQRSKNDRYYYEPQYHTFPELVFGIRGPLEVYVNGRWEKIEPGIVWVFLPGAIHTERYFRQNSEYRLFWMVISPESLGFHMTAYNKTRGYHLKGKRLALKIPSRSELHQIASLPQVVTEQFSQIHFQSLLMDTLCRVRSYMDNSSSQDIKIPSHYQAIEQIKNYLDEHYQRDITLAELGRMVHYSTCHLNMLFRQEMGIPIRQYVLKKKVAEAEKLLKTTDMEVKQIAYIVGFQDPLYFSRTFRRFRGYPPSKVVRS